MFISSFPCSWRKQMGSKVVSIKEVLEKCLPQKTTEGGFPKDKILENWPRIVSEKAAECSQPSMIKNKILVITVSNSAWLHQLALQKNEMVKRIERIAGKGLIREVRFKLGKVNVFKR